MICHVCVDSQPQSIRNGNKLKDSVLLGIALSCILTAQLYSEEADYKEGDLLVHLFGRSDVQSFSQDFESIGLRPAKVLSRRMNMWLFDYDTPVSSRRRALRVCRESELP